MIGGYNRIGRAKLPEERRRFFEAVAMGVATVILIALSRLEGRLFELSERLSEQQEFFTSLVYFGLINVNVILILVLSFLIFRNIVKLVVERRRGLIGSRLRTKLVITLIFFAFNLALVYITSKGLYTPQP